MNQQADAVVVGAGPVGLLTAIELTLGGARVLELERLATSSLDMKAGGLGPLGLEALERRGVDVPVLRVVLARVPALFVVVAISSQRLHSHEGAKDITSKSCSGQDYHRTCVCTPA